MKDSNVGEVGVKSIRIQGQKLDNLPLGQGEIARMQLADAIAYEREQTVKSIHARYPKVSQDYLNGALREARSNIENFKEEKMSIVGKMNEYQMLLRQCEGKTSLRQLEPQIDEIVRSDLSKDEKVAAIKELKVDAVEYDADALSVQLTQFHVSLKRFDDAIEQETDTIIELSENLALVKQRDRELEQAMVKGTPDDGAIGG